MKIQYKTPAAEDRHIPYKLSGVKLTLDDELTLKLSKYEQDEDVHKNICLDTNGNLVMGVIPGEAIRYVAEIDIPARTYHEEDSGETTEDGEKIMVPVPDPYDPENTTLTLWETED